MDDYLEKLKKDADGKKFLQALADYLAANEFMAFQAGTPVEQNGEMVAPVMMQSDTLAALLTSLIGKLPTLDGGKSPVIDAGAATILGNILTALGNPLSITPTADIGVTAAQLPATLSPGENLSVSSQVPADKYLPVANKPMGLNIVNDTTTLFAGSGLFGGYLVTSSTNGTVTVLSGETYKIDTMPVAAKDYFFFPHPIAIIDLTVIAVDCVITVLWSDLPILAHEPGLPI